MTATLRVRVLCSPFPRYTEKPCDNGQESSRVAEELRLLHNPRRARCLDVQCNAHCRLCTVGLRRTKRHCSSQFREYVVECPSNFGDMLTDFNCYVSIVRWLIARPLPPSRERSVQDYRVIQENNNQIGSNISCILFIRNTVSQAMKNAIIVDCPWKGRSRSFSLILPDRSLVQSGRAACHQ